MVEFLDTTLAELVPEAPAPLPSVGAPAIHRAANLSPGDAYTANLSRTMAGWWTGEKFPGGYTDPAGFARILTPDLATLRARSSDLFNRNPYARGIIRRLVTNEIHTGLAPEVAPIAEILGMDGEAASDWSDDVEIRWKIWSESNPSVCDVARRDQFGAIQQTVRREALIDGDCLVVLRSDKDTRLPTIEVIPGGQVLTPMAKNVPSGVKIVDGVEVDSSGRHLAYWVQRPGDGRGLPQIDRVPATVAGGRRNAWLVYGSDRRAGTVRGEPLLGIILQSLSEIDKYRDSVQRKALVNSMIAVFVKRDKMALGTDPFSNAGISSGTDGPFGPTTGQETPREFNVTNYHPGLAMESLAPGESVEGFNSAGIDLDFPVFEEAIVRLMGWCLQIPPEILQLGFGSNYAASQGAMNEFDVYLGERRCDIARQFLQPVYVDWLISEVAARNISAPGLLAASVDRSKFATLEAWTTVDWAGAVKPTSDPVKMANAAKILINELGISNRHRVSKQLGLGKWSQTSKVLEKENRELAAIQAPMIAAQNPQPAEQEEREDDDEVDDP